MRPGVLSFLTTAEGEVRSVAFSPDGKTIAAGYARRRWAGWCCGTWRAAAPGGGPLPVKEGGVSSVAFIPDGKTIAAGYGGAAAGWCCGTWRRGTARRIPSP